MAQPPLEYLVAGPADDEDFAQAEHLAEMLMVSLPTIKCTLLPILPDDWTDYVAERAGFLGCKQRAPLIWMSTGVVVGGFAEFAAECDKKYGVAIKGIDVRALSRFPSVRPSAHAPRPRARSTRCGQRWPRRW